MANIFERAQGLLNRTMKKSTPVLVDYLVYNSAGQLDYQINDLTLWRGNTFFSGLADMAVTVQRGEADFLGDVDDFIIGTDPVQPKKGAKIIEQISGKIWEIASPLSSELGWRYSDNTKMTYRIHVQQVDQQT